MSFYEILDGVVQHSKGAKTMDVREVLLQDLNIPRIIKRALAGQKIETVEDFMRGYLEDAPYTGGGYGRRVIEEIFELLLNS